MALQLHRSFASGGLYGSLCAPSRLSIMQSQCKGLQNYSGICLPYSLYCSGTKHGKLAHLSFRKAGEVCRMTRKQLKDLRYKVERDSYLNNSTYNEYKIGATAIFPAQPYVSLPYANHYKSFFTPSCMESRLSFSTSSKERGSRRFFSVKATASKIGGNTSFFKDFDVFREKTKSFVRSSNPDACSQVAVSTQPVKTTVSSTSKKSVSRNSPKDIGGDKKDIKSKSSVSIVTENSSRKQEHKAEGKIVSGADRKDNKSKSSVSAVTENSSQEPKTEVKKKHQKNKKQVKLPVSTASSGDAKAKQASQSKKSDLYKADQTSQPSETKKSPTKKKSTKPKAPKHNTPAVLVQVNGMPHKTLKPLYPPSGKSVVVVESVTKAKVIQGYLGDMFEVLPSYGHVRDLAGRSGSVRPDEEFSMVWEVPTAAWTHLKSIKVALNGAKNLILASDPDREGEAIAWHIMEMLQQQEALHKDITVARVVFHEITESSIKSALQTPRDIDANLVHAYLARRALDYLIGFSISPLLWRKLPACQSAGRVQSAALALICDREMEIDEFKPQEYWSVKVDFKKNDSDELLSHPSHLTHCGSKKLEQLSISSDGEARNIEKKITSSCFEVVDSKRSKARKNPPAPYITSTLQQDAANKLHFSASYTMKLAQKLYEGIKLSDKEATGLITYMRTDGLHVSDAATKDIRSLVTERYGHDFASESTRKYYKKVKNAQEAHEAIRPTNIWKLPSMLTGVLDEDSLKLYTLIWSRTLACQMEPSVIDQIQVDIGDAEKSLIFRSTCSKVQFLGYQVVYKDLEVAATGYNEKEGDANDEIFEVLSTLKLGDPLQLGKVELKQHSTQPSSRYSEASLVKKLEELGIGRPSTYASTIKVLKDRNYVTTKSRVLYPEFRGRMVSAFLSHHFSEVTDYSFTADMETELDNVSAGITEWKGLLKDYWTRFSTYCDNASTVDIRQVEKMLEETFGHFLFSSLPDKSRTCPSCSVGNLIFKVSRFGAGYFIGCDQHPKCKYIAKMIYANDEDDEPPKKNELFSDSRLLGLHPGSSEKILLKNGPYGFYVQLGEDRNGYLPKRASVSQIKDVDSITVEDALDLLRYPIKLGNHPDDSEPVYIKLAKHGFSIRHRRTIAPVPKNTDPKDITIEKALRFLLSKDAKKCGRPKNKPKREDDF